MKIRLTTVYVGDQDKALRFYTDSWALPGRLMSATARIDG